jgi:hypothetical protein
MMIGTMVAALFVFRVGIPFLQKKFTRPIWEYKPTTPAEVLHRHDRFAVRMVYAQFFVVVGFVSSLSQWAMLERFDLHRRPAFGGRSPWTVP